MKLRSLLLYLMNTPVLWFVLGLTMVGAWMLGELLFSASSRLDWLVLAAGVLGEAGLCYFLVWAIVGPDPNWRVPNQQREDNHEHANEILTDGQPPRVDGVDAR